jgi:hypothetical protein
LYGVHKKEFLIDAFLPLSIHLHFDSVPASLRVNVSKEPSTMWM